MARASPLDDWCVEAMRGHDYLAPRSDLGRGAEVVAVEVGQHQTPEIRPMTSEPTDRLGDQRPRADNTGIDEGQPVAALPHIGRPEGETEEMQVWSQLDGVHEATVGAVSQDSSRVTGSSWVRSPR